VILWLQRQADVCLKGICYY